MHRSSIAPQSQQQVIDKIYASLNNTHRKDINLSDSQDLNKFLLLPNAAYIEEQEHQSSFPFTLCYKVTFIFKSWRWLPLKALSYVYREFYFADYIAIVLWALSRGTDKHKPIK